jgi:hypothetical protein
MIMQATKADMYNAVRQHNMSAEDYLSGNPENASRLRGSMVIDTKRLPPLPIDAEAFAPQSDTGYFMPLPGYKGPKSLPKQNIFGPYGGEGQKKTNFDQSIDIAPSREAASPGQLYRAPDGTTRRRGM